MTRESSENRTAVLGKGEGGRSILRAVCLAWLIATVTGALLLSGGAALIYALPSTSVYTAPIGAAIGALTALVGGVAAGRLHKHAGALSGLLFGVLYFAVMLVLGRFVSTGYPLLGRVLGYGVLLLLSLLGGTLGGMRSGGRKRRRRR